MSGHESALVIRVPQERRDKNTEVFGHAMDRATKEVGQRVLLQFLVEIVCSQRGGRCAITLPVEWREWADRWKRVSSLT